MKLAQRAGPASQMTLTQRPAAGSQGGPGGVGLLSASELERERALAPVITNPNRARITGLPETYSVAPRSTFDPAAAMAGAGDGSLTGARPIGASGIEAFRKMTNKGKKRH